MHQVTYLKRGFLILSFHAYLRLQINYANLVCSNNTVSTQVAEYCKMQL